MTWAFSDGTTAELGGEIVGASLFAQQLRASLDDGGLFVAIGRLPGGIVPLDVTDVALFDAWLTQQTLLPSRVADRIRMTKRPDDVPSLPDSDTSELDALIAELPQEDRDAVVY